VTAVAEPAIPPDVYRRRYWVLAVACVAFTIIGMALTILNVAIPALTRELGASTSDLQWIFATYGLLFSGLVVTGGALGDRFGRRRGLIVGLVIFGLASTLGAFATEPFHLIVARAFMGVGAALIMPGTLSIITTVFPPEQRERAIGIWAGVGGLGFIIGPPIGGLLLHEFWWGSVMLASPPVVLVTIVAMLAVVPESRDPAHRPLDALGSVLSIVMITALVFGFIEAPSEGWTGAPVLLAFGVSAVAVVAFILRELKTANPMLDVRLFRRTTFTAPALMLVFGFFVVWGLQFLLPQFLEFVQGESVVTVGLLLSVISITWCVSCTFATRATAGLGERYAIAGGLLVTAVGVLLLLPAVNGPSTWWLVISLLVIGAGMGLAMVPSTTMLVAALPPEKAGVGSAMNDVTREFGTSFGVAVLGSVVAFGYQDQLGSAADVLPASERAAAENNIGDAVSSAEQLGGRAGEQLIDAAHAAFTSGMRAAIVVGAVVLVATAAVSLVLLPHQRRLHRWHWSGALGRPHHLASTGAEGSS